jgi:peroxiredoxin family protein
MEHRESKRGLSKVAIFLHSGEYDRVHQGLSIAAAAVAEGRPVEVFLFWWALERLAREDIDEPEFPSRPDVADRFESKAIPTLRSLLTYLRESGRCTLYACSGSLAIQGLSPEKVERLVGPLIGWNGILQLTAGVTDRFYL